MRLMLSALVALTTHVAPVSSKTLVVRDDGGGIISNYTDAVRKYDAIKIDGRCVSACLIYTMHPKACATKRAKLGMHWAYSDAGFSEKATRAIYRNLRPSLQRAWPWDKIPKDKGGFIYARGVDHLPRCK